jgi:hypothetical protein
LFVCACSSSTRSHPRAFSGIPFRQSAYTKMELHFDVAFQARGMLMEH